MSELCFHGGSPICKANGSAQAMYSVIISVAYAKDGNATSLWMVIIVNFKVSSLFIWLKKSMASK